MNSNKKSVKKSDKKPITSTPRNRTDSKTGTQKVKSLTFMTDSSGSFEMQNVVPAGSKMHQKQKQFILDSEYNRYLQSLLKEQILKRAQEKVLCSINDQVAHQAALLESGELEMKELEYRIEEIHMAEMNVKLMNKISRLRNEMFSVIELNEIDNIVSSLKKYLQVTSSQFIFDGIESPESENEYKKLSDLLEKTCCLLNDVNEKNGVMNDVIKMSREIEQINELKSSIEKLYADIIAVQEQIRNLVLRMSSLKLAACK